MANNSSPDCIFCSIAAHQAQADIVFENDTCVAFRDIKPEAATHLLVIPKKHIETFASLSGETDPLLANLMRTVIEVIHLLQLEKNCKIAINNGREAGQIVPHVHVHILSTKKAG